MLAAWTQSILPLLYVGLPSFYGAWLHHILGMSQHAGLQENVLDHRLNTRTILLNPLFRFLYSNMNFHLEHHLFPMVPYHALPKLHEHLKDDLPRPYSGLISTYAEIIPALLRQRREPSYFVQRRV
jgi:fatty acid desaturase